MGVSTKYGNVTTYASVASQIIDTADGEARYFMHIDNSTAAAQFIDFLVTVQVPVSAAVVTGDTYSVYTIDSLDDVHWTDDIVIDPEGGDSADKLAAAKLSLVVDAFHTSAAPVTSIASFNVASLYPTMPPYLAFVFKNDTSGDIKAGASASYVPITLSAT
jgi:hypothetical protein